MIKRCLTFVFAVCFAVLSQAILVLSAQALDIKSTEFTLANGLHVILIEDHRAPVVTHTIWYRVGAADEQVGKTGLAHFLEHLLFKGTPKYPEGMFDRLLDQNGGEKNAFTQRDATAYYERVAADKLPLMMELEADRMQNLQLNADSVKTELKVVQEERRQSTDSNPGALLGEHMAASLYLAHPYGRPIIGWNDDVARLTLDDALAFYKQHYTPANATVVIVGDVTPQVARDLADKFYAPLKNSFAPQPRHRTVEPPPLVERRITMHDARVATPSISRSYFTPSYITAKPKEADALSLLSVIIGDSAQGRLYKKLVLEKKIATSAGAGFNGSQLDNGEFSIYASPADGVDMARLESEIDAIIAEVISKGVTAQELSDAKDRAQADAIYGLDQPSSFGGIIGLAATMGLTPDEVLAHIDVLPTVTLEEVQKAAAYLDIKRAVTGLLLPEKK